MTYKAQGFIQKKKREKSRAVILPCLLSHFSLSIAISVKINSNHCRSFNVTRYTIHNYGSHHNNQKKKKKKAGDKLWLFNKQKRQVINCNIWQDEGSFSEHDACIHTVLLFFFLTTIKHLLQYQIEFVKKLVLPWISTCNGLKLHWTFGFIGEFWFISLWRIHVCNQLYHELVKPNIFVLICCGWSKHKWCYFGWLVKWADLSLTSCHNLRAYYRFWSSATHEIMGESPRP